MKYIYAYRNSDGIRCESSIEAKSRDEVFISLRKQGIRAIKVIAADGSKANGEIVVKGVRKRVVFGLSILLSLLVGFAAYLAGQKGEDELIYPRRWIGRNLHITFENPCDALLSHFAQPGMRVDENEIPSIDIKFKKDFRESLGEKLKIIAEDSQDD